MSVGLVKTPAFLFLTSVFTVFSDFDQAPLEM